MSQGARDLIALAAERGLLDETAVRAALGDETVSIDILVSRGMIRPEDADTLRRATEAVVRSDARPGSDRIGRYVKVREIGHGGFGAVWLAWDPQLSRHVAVKILKAIDADDVARFRREASLAASLSHPNIAAVFEVAEDPPHIAMQYIEGHDAGEAKVTLPEALRIVKDAAGAVQAAHENGIIHRDIKPQNIRIDPHGRVFVMDFGLAKRHGTESTLSQSGTILGTPAFMSPEQAEGHVNLDARTDVYGLGATLYALIAGRPPFLGSSLEVLRQVQEAEPPALDVDPDVRTLISKALEKDVARRYRSAKELAEEIGRFLAGEAILARPASMAYRLRRRVRRNPWAYVMGLAAAVMLAVAGVTAAVMMRRTHAFELSRQAAESLRDAEIALARWKSERYHPKHDVTPARREVRNAILKLGDALRLQPDAHPALAMMGWAHLELEETDEALKALESAVRAAPDEGRYHWWLALAQRKKAADLTDEARQSPSAAERARREREAEELKRKYIAATRAALQKPWKAEPWERELAEGWLAFYEKQSDVALRDVARRAREGGEVALVDLGRIYTTRDDFPRARQALDEAIGRAPSFALAYAWRAAAVADEAANLVKKGGERPGVETAYQEAMANAFDAVAVDPEMVDAWNVRGTVRLGLATFLRSGGTDATDLFVSAIADYSKAIELDPLEAKLWVHRAAARVNWGVDRKEAADLLRAAIDVDLARAVELNPHDPYPLLCRGQARVNLGKAVADDGGDPTALYRAAIDEDFTPAIGFDPSDPDVRRRRGQARTNLGYNVFQAGGDPTEHYRAAVEEDLSKGVQLDAENFESWLRLGEAEENWAVYLWKHGDDAAAMFASAELHLTRAIGLNGRCAEAYFVRARVRFEKTMSSRRDPRVMEEAIDDYTRALEENPAWTQIYEARAHVRIERLNLAVVAGEDPVPLYGPIVDDMTRAMKASPGDADLYLDRAQARIQWAVVIQSRGEDGADLLHAALDEDLVRAAALAPGSPMLLRFRGLARVTLAADVDDAEDLLRAAVEEDYGPLAKAEPDVVGHWLALGDARSRWANNRMQTGLDPTEQFKAAIDEDFKRATDLDRACVAAWHGRAETRVNWAIHLLRSGEDAVEQQRKAVDEDFARATELDKSNPKLWRQRGTAAGTWGNLLDRDDDPEGATAVFERAEEMLTKAIDLGETDAEAWRRRGLVRQRLRRLEGALADYEKAVERNPALEDTLRGVIESLRRELGKSDF